MSLYLLFNFKWRNWWCWHCYSCLLIKSRSTEPLVIFAILCYIWNNFLDLFVCNCDVTEICCQCDYCVDSSIAIFSLPISNNFFTKYSADCNYTRTLSVVRDIFARHPEEAAIDFFVIEVSDWEKFYLCLYVYLGNIRRFYL